MTMMMAMSCHMSDGMCITILNQMMTPAFLDYGYDYDSFQFNVSLPENSSSSSSSSPSFFSSQTISLSSGERGSLHLLFFLLRGAGKLERSSRQLLDRRIFLCLCVLIAATAWMSLSLLSYWFLLHHLYSSVSVRRVFHTWMNSSITPSTRPFIRSPILQSCHPCIYPSPIPAVLLISISLVPRGHENGMKMSFSRWNLAESTKRTPRPQLSSTLSSPVADRPANGLSALGELLVNIQWATISKNKWLIKWIINELVIWLRSIPGFPLDEGLPVLWPMGESLLNVILFYLTLFVIYEDDILKQKTRESNVFHLKWNRK